MALSRTTGLLAVVLAILALAVWGYQVCQVAVFHAALGEAHLRRAQQVLSPQDLASFQLENFHTACAEVTQAEVEFRHAGSALGPLRPLVRSAAGLPGLGNEIASPIYLLDAAGHLAVAGREVCAGIRPLAESVFPETETPSRQGMAAVAEAVIEGLTQGHQHLEAARQLVDSAETARSRAGRVRWLRRTNEALDEFDRQLPRLKRGLDLVLKGPDLLTTLVGMSGPQTYLILSQNNAELRPTGGFVSSYAQVTVERGEVVDFIYGEFPKAPEVKGGIEIPSWWARLERPAWVYWDTNWTADFPTAARQAEWFYEAGGNVAQPLDGVIAIDPTAAQMLLKVLGSIYVPEYDVRVDSENLLSLLEQYRAYVGEPLSEERRTPHKELLGEIAKGLLEKIVQADLKQMLAVGQALGQALQQKHILLFFDDPELAALLAKQGWDGAISTTTDDFLFVVDANMGRAKVDTQVEKTIRYEVIIGSDHSITSKATLDYYNGSSAAEVGQEHGWRGGTYWDYVRLYVPEGSLLAETKGNDYPTQITAEGGKTAFGNLFVVPVGERAQLSYTYVNATKIHQVGGRYVYRLTAQKQAGTLANELLITMSLPEGARLLSADPKPTSVQNNVVQYRSALLTDQVFEITFR